MKDLMQQMQPQKQNQNAEKEAPMTRLLKQLPNQLAKDASRIDEIVGGVEGSRWDHIALQQKMLRIMQALVQGQKALQKLQGEMEADKLKQHFQQEVFQSAEDTTETPGEEVEELDE